MRVGDQAEETPLTGMHRKHSSNSTHGQIIWEQAEMGQKKLILSNSYLEIKSLVTFFVLDSVLSACKRYKELGFFPLYRWKSSLHTNINKYHIAFNLKTSLAPHSYSINILFSSQLASAGRQQRCSCKPQTHSRFYPEALCSSDCLWLSSRKQPTTGLL